MRNLEVCGITHLPASDEKIERQIMNPSGQQEPAILEECGDTRECAEAALRFAPVRGDKAGVKQRKDQWEYRARHQRGSPPDASGENKNQPSEKRRRVRDRKNSFRSHASASTGVRRKASTAAAVALTQTANTIIVVESGSRTDCPRRACQTRMATKVK